MIQKNITISPPLDNSKIVQIERLFSTLFNSALQSRSGSYTGDGTASKAIALNIKALFVIILRKTSGSYNAAIAIREANGYTYVGGSIIADGISFTADGISLGANSNVNQAGVNYAYFAIG